MKRVTGIGGVFFESPDPARLTAWYRDHLGLDIQAWGGVAFSWSGPDNPAGHGSTIWNAVARDSKQFAPGRATFMINYRVDDLHALLAALRREGCQVLDEVSDDDYGKFGWLIDPDGNKVELWQPPQGS